MLWCSVYSPIPSRIFVNLGLLRESPGRRSERETNQGRKNANMDVKAYLFYFTVDYDQADGANTANDIGDSEV